MGVIKFLVFCFGFLVFGEFVVLGFWFLVSLLYGFLGFWLKFHEVPWKFHDN